jgi:hypothetical protein
LDLLGNFDVTLDKQSSETFFFIDRESNLLRQQLIDLIENLFRRTIDRYLIDLIDLRNRKDQNETDQGECQCIHRQTNVEEDEQNKTELKRRSPDERAREKKERTRVELVKLFQSKRLRPCFKSVVPFARIVFAKAWA